MMCAPPETVCAANQELSLSSTTQRERLQPATTTTSQSATHLTPPPSVPLSLWGDGFLCRWFCHVDDDVYVNIRQLVRLLLSYDLQKEHVYLGRWSLNRDTKIKVGKNMCLSLRWVYYVLMHYYSRQQLTHYRTENFPSLVSVCVCASIIVTVCQYKLYHSVIV